MTTVPTVSDFQTYAEQICEVGHRAYQRGFVTAWDGNLSIRVDDNLVLCTPTRTSKGNLTPSSLCLVDLDGNPVSASGRATTEIRMHLLIYRNAPVEDRVRSVVHLHPVHATTLAVCRTKPPRGILAETELYLGDVALVPYRLTGTQEFADAFLPYLPGRVAYLLENHGAVTTGTDLLEAWAHMEILEQACQVAILSDMTRKAVPLEETDVQALLTMRDRGRAARLK